jgi:S-adenosylmethionine:diacylglycerol 3-amino-3-carboxypropyl transferase
MTRETAWEAGRFDAGGGRQKLLFGRMYEDAAIEAAAFAPGGRVFCIASAGCVALQLAPHHAVTAVDINPVQLAYAQRRAAGGPTQHGAAERIVGLGRRLMPLFGWRRRAVRSFLALDQPAEQVAFWNQHLNTAAFRWVTDRLLSVASLRSIYASSFLEILPPHFGRVLRARLERCWKTHPNRTNPYASGFLLGELPAPAPLPDGEGIHFVCGDAASFLESCGRGSFDGFALSNILDGATESYRQRLCAAVQRAGTADSVVVLRSFAEPRHQTATNLATRDRSILWGIVDVRPARDL